MKRRLFLITDDYPFGLGETYIENEVQYLSESFEKVYVISINRKDKQTREMPENFEAYKIEKKKMSLIELIKFDYIFDFFSEKINLKDIKRRVNFIYTGHIIKKRILEVVKKENLNLDECVFYSYWFLFGAYAISKIKAPNSIKISRAHRYDIYEEKEIQFLKSYILSKLTNVLPCSKQGANYLKVKYPKFENKINHSYLGTKNEQDLNLKKNNFNLMSCSHTVPIKRIDLIIEGLQHLDKIGNEIKWIHIGGAGENLERLKKMANERLKNIKFEFLGHLSNNKVVEYYKNNNIKCFINLSSGEGLPVSMMEVQSFGIPIVATDVGGVGEIVNDKTGVLLKENPTSEEIGLALKKMLYLSEEEFKIKQKDCFENWNDKFNAEKNYNEFIEKYLKGKK